MEEETRKRKLSEGEEILPHELLWALLTQIRQFTVRKEYSVESTVEKEVKNLLSDCCDEVCETLGEEEDDSDFNCFSEEEHDSDFKCFSEKEYDSDFNCFSEDEHDFRSHINSLPDEVLILILRKLHYPDFCICKRVCRRWNEITKNNTIFKKLIIDVKRLRRGPPISEIISNHLAALPSHLTHLKLKFDVLHTWFVNFCDFSKEIRNHCPNLHLLFLDNIKFDVCGENLDIAIQMPKHIRVLVLHNTIFFKGKRLRDVDCDIPKIQVLDLSHSKRLYIRPSSFLMLPYLKKLLLAGCTTDRYLTVYPFEPAFSDLQLEPEMNPEDYFFASVVKVCNQLQTLDLELTLVRSTTFRTIYTYCVCLTELFICFTPITDEDLIFEDPKTVLPNLKVLCLRNCQVTVSGVTSFLNACPSLENVYVGSKDINPADDFHLLFIPKVHVLYGYKHCNHYKEVDYMGK